MSFDFKDVEKFFDNLETLREDSQKIVEEMVIDEGRYAARQARDITKNQKIVNTSAYRWNWHTGDASTLAYESKEPYDGRRPRKKGDTYTIDVYNNVDYAKHLEYGFRSHYVPPQHLSGKYKRKFPKGLYVGTPGEYVKGKYVLREAIRRTEVTQNARLTRKWNAKVKEYIERGL